MKTMDFSLYVIIDIDYLNLKKINPYAALVSVLKGGASAVQLRAKHSAKDEFLKLAVAMNKICRKYKVPLIINDFPAIAADSKAAGAHVGTKDMSVVKARKILKKNYVLGVSASTMREAMRADKMKADYIGIGPVFATAQKSTKPLGIAAMKTLASKLSTPIVAIGGINGYNIPRLKKAGINNFCFISAILGSRNILKKTKMVKSIIYRKEK